jgi:taurine dioxygenase
MDDWTVEQGLKWRRLAPFGIEIDRDLRKPMSAAAAKHFVRLTWEHGLVVARGQSLSMDEQTALLANLGPILKREGETGYISTVNAAEASLAELTFHADGAYTEHPLDALSLHAVDVVDGASSTRFVHAERALTTLPSELRNRIAHARIDMVTPSFETLGLRSCDVREHNPMMRGEGPAIHGNPHNGRACIWVSEMHTARILDMDWEESRALLNAVFEHLYAADAVYDHVWHQGDIVIWDNVALQHARGPLHGAGRRVLQRVIVGTQGVAPHVRNAA